jgi:uncharacterized protein YkwD/LysM repeat protein
LFLCLAWILPSTYALAKPDGLPPFQEGTSTPAQEETTPTPSVPAPADIINAVNNLRIQNGLNALTVHDVLMDIAAQQANALAASEGAIGHNRPCGMTLGQELLLKGFPLWGDLSQDGYRSENWGTAMTAEDAISMWLGDDLHTNTMLSSYRSDIGAAVAVSDQIYVVLETALRTNSGQMQYPAYAILTSIPITQAACVGQITPNAAGSISQYSIPVAVSTARPDGDVVHEVKYGQTLWGLAIQYKVSIEQIKRLNNLTNDTIIPGWKLLVQKAATQPAPATVTLSNFEQIKENLYSPTPLLTATPEVTEAAFSMDAGSFLKQNSLVVVAFLISFSVLVAAIVGFGKKK